MVETNSGLSASERAYGRIRDGILDGRLEPGTMLGEAILATELGISRTPVHVALTRLQEEGWIVIYPKRGALVQGLGDRELVELADARLVLESTAVKRAPEHLRTELAEKLDQSIAAQREAFDREDITSFIDLTIEFHRGFVEAGGNSILIELYDRLADRHRFALFTAGQKLLARCEEIIAEHKGLAAHFRSAESAEFEAALRAHISDAGTMPPAIF